jgi:hypothetical protein
MKRLMSLLQQVLIEMGTWCRTSTTRDFETISSRVEHEGLSFLTITLPNFGKDFEKSLDQGYVDPSLFAGFQRRGELPVFLGGFLDHVFDRDTGLLLDSSGLVCPGLGISTMPIDEQTIRAIRSIRQIAGLYGKLGDDTTPRRKRRAILDYLVCESEVQAMDASFLGARRSLSGLVKFLSEGKDIALWTTFLGDLARDL